MYRFVTSVFCAGTLDDGKQWSGFRIILTRFVSPVAKHPLCVDVLKCSSTFDDSILQSIPRGSAVEVLFDRFGRVASVSLTE